MAHAAMRTGHSNPPREMRSPPAHRGETRSRNRSSNCHGAVTPMPQRWMTPPNETTRIGRIQSDQPSSRRLRHPGSSKSATESPKSKNYLDRLDCHDRSGRPLVSRSAPAAHEPNCPPGSNSSGLYEQKHLDYLDSLDQVRPAPLATKAPRGSVPRILQIRSPISGLRNHLDYLDRSDPPGNRETV